MIMKGQPAPHLRQYFFLALCAFPQTGHAAQMSHGGSPMRTCGYRCSKNARHHSIDSSRSNPCRSNISEQHHWATHESMQMKQAAVD